MNSYYCNPLNLSYRYQFLKDIHTGEIDIFRESGDPSLILFKGRYYLFASMGLGFWVSETLADWEYHRLPDTLPLYDYAPDVRVMGDYIYFSASARDRVCDYYRTKDPTGGVFERIPGTFPFWDPNLFVDDDGRVYFYWGCANQTPIWGTELDPQTLKPLHERRELVWGRPDLYGFERWGEDNRDEPVGFEKARALFEADMSREGKDPEAMPPFLKELEICRRTNMPFIEGAWMDKHDGRYYLQVANPGTEYNVYNDAVYISDHPLGPFTLAENNPYSFKPGGFITGAGHGSTLTDQDGNVWHTATMRICRHNTVERRLGLWPAGFDADGSLFCNQRYGDWPVCLERVREDPFAEPEWMLLSYGKEVTSDSYEEGFPPSNASDEQIRTLWRAADNAPGHRLRLDLGKMCMIHAIQVNFGDEGIQGACPPSEMSGEHEDARRTIDTQMRHTRWVLHVIDEDGIQTMAGDRSSVDTDLPHDLIVIEEGIRARYIELTVLEMPFNQPAAVSGLRVFGQGDGALPAEPVFEVCRTGDRDMDIAIDSVPETTGYTILWGYAPDRLYHSWTVCDPKTAGRITQHIGALAAGQTYYIRVDAFNECGITHGTVCPVD